MIERWLQWNMEERREAWEFAPDVRDGRGVYFRNQEIRGRDGGTLAEFLRRTDVPTVRMALPNELTIVRFRDIYKSAERVGAQAIVLPNRVLDQSNIVRRSMKLIDSEVKPQTFRPPQQVIKATVQRPWERKTRDAYFMSGYDLNEKGLSYFFCELPPGATPTTVEEAYQSLKPESVLRAEAQGKKIMRQGDMFFIQMRGEEGPPNGSIRTDARLFDTNHFVSQGARHNGLVMVRGRVSHNPIGRRPDHHSLRLPGKDWWIAVRNTVPVVDSNGW